MRNKIKVLCESCGVSLSRFPCQVKKAKHTLCQSCSVEYNRARMRDWNKENNPKEWHRVTALKLRDHPNYKGFSVRPDGYLRIALGGDTRQLFHRFLMEQKLGRKLKKTEMVHHKDGDPKNNNLDNLCVITQSEHINLHRNELKEGRQKNRLRNQWNLN